jgi:hypothetical protein
MFAHHPFTSQEKTPRLPTDNAPGSAATSRERIDVAKQQVGFGFNNVLCTHARTNYQSRPYLTVIDELVEYTQGWGFASLVFNQAKRELSCILACTANSPEIAHKTKDGWTKFVRHRDRWSMDRFRRRFSGFSLVKPQSRQQQYTHE